MWRRSDGANLSLLRAASQQPRTSLPPQFSAETNLYIASLRQVRHAFEYVNTGDLDAALSQAERAMQANPDDPRAQQAYAYIDQMRQQGSQQDSSSPVTPGLP